MSAAAPTPDQRQALPQRQRQRRARIGGKVTRRHRGLNALQADYLLGRLCGKSKRRAALDAGYADETARNAAQNVEGKRRGSFSVMRLFVQAIEDSQSELSGTKEKGIWRPQRNQGDDYGNCADRVWCQK